MEKMDGRRGPRFSMTMQLLLLSILPMLVTVVVIAWVSVEAMMQGMQSEALTGLADLAASIEASFNVLDEGEWHLEGDELYKGEMNCSANMEMFDEFVVNSDAEITLFYGDTRYVTSLIDNSVGGRLVGTVASEQVTDEVLKKHKTYQSTNVQVNGESYYAYYMPLRDKVSNQVVGMVFAGKPCRDVNNFISVRINRIVISTVAIILVTMIVCAIIGRRIAKNISKMEEVVRELGTGNLTISPSTSLLRKTDEIGAMARELESFRATLSDIVSDIKHSAAELAKTGENLDQMAAQTNSSTNEISIAVEGVSKGALSQAEEIETATQQISNMGDEIGEIVQRVSKLDHISSEMKKAGEVSEEIVRDLSQSNDRTVEAIERIGKQVFATNESVEKIRTAIDAITGIANQTNLLSLNASIEAARAGDQGKGFAVVASQIQKLAEQSGQSAKEIEGIVNILYNESEMSVAAMEEMREIIKAQEEKLSETTRQFDKVNEGIVVSRDETSNIKGKTDICNQSRDQVVDVMANLSAISEENASASEETASSMQELNATIHILAEEAVKVRDMSQKLEDKFRIFKL